MIPPGVPIDANDDVASGVNMQLEHNGRSSSNIDSRSCTRIAVVAAVAVAVAVAVTVAITSED
jgi:hypothetical protein